MSHGSGSHLSKTRGKTAAWGLLRGNRTRRKPGAHLWSWQQATPRNSRKGKRESHIKRGKLAILPLMTHSSASTGLFMCSTKPEFCNSPSATASISDRRSVAGRLPLLPHPGPPGPAPAVFIPQAATCHPLCSMF